jgi:lantibiotic biosynthesis protein
MTPWKSRAFKYQRPGILGLTRVISDAADVGSASPSDWGPPLLRYYVGRATDEQSSVESALAMRDAAIDALPRFLDVPGLYGGVAGIGWMCAHLDRLQQTSHDEQYAEVDEFLSEHVRERTWGGHYDLITGLVGIGTYFLERLPSAVARESLCRIVGLLADRATSDAEGTRWKTAPDLLPDFQRDVAPDGYYNLGVAHGAPGVLAFLSLGFSAGIERERCRELADGVVTWFRVVREPDSALGQFGPWWTGTSKSKASRLAWCYGDLGLATSLALAGVAFHRAEWTALATDIAQKAAARRDPETRVQDPGLCHGSAGVSHLFARLAQYTAESQFDVASQYWLAQTLRFHEQHAGRYGLQTIRTAQENGEWIDRWHDSAEFLTGATGIGLALLGSVSNLDPSWDRPLLLS